MDTLGLYANALCPADLDAGPDAEPDADGHRNPQTGGQRYLYIHRHTHADAHPIPDRYLYANRNGDGYSDDDPHGHSNRHKYQHADAFQHGYRYPNLDTESHAQRHANADLHTGLGTSPAMRLTSGDPVSEERGKNLPPEGDVKPRRLNLQLTERQQLIIGFVLVILVAVSMLYCLGFASVALRNAWESGPLPWSENGNYPAESTPLPPTPAVEPADSSGSLQ